MPNGGHRLHADEDLVTGVVQRGGGAALDPHTRADMEGRFGHDFSDVRVHTDAGAHESAQSVNARAYTVGSDIVFQRGSYDPASQSGRYLLAHELTHVVQQRSGPVAGTDTGAGFAVSDPGDRFEREADTTAARLMSAPAPSADSVMALQELGGNQMVGRYLQRCGSTPPDQCGCHDEEEDGRITVQRQEAHPRDVDPRPNFGPAVPKLELPPIFSFGVKEGKPYLKVEEVEGINGEAPELWLNPGDVTAEVEKWARERAGGTDGGTGLPRNMPPTRLPNDMGMRWAATMCQRPGADQSPFCPQLPWWLRPQPPTPAPTGPVPSQGPLWTDRVTFQRDQPKPGTAGAGGPTPEGKAALDGVVEWLKVLPTLRVRLIGKSSSEGGAEHNQQLATRRVALVAQAITAAGFGDRIQDPIPSDGNETGCQALGVGKWSCGDTKAAAEPDPADRVVEVTYSIAMSLQLPPPTFGRPATP